MLGDHVCRVTHRGVVALALVAALFVTDRCWPNGRQNALQGTNSRLNGLCCLPKLICFWMVVWTVHSVARPPWVNGARDDPSPRCWVKQAGESCAGVHCPLRVPPRSVVAYLLAL